MSKTYIEVAPNGILSGAVSRTVQPGSAMAAHIQVNLGTATAVAIEGAIINTERSTPQSGDFVEYDRITSSGIHPTKMLPSVYRFRAIGGDVALVAVVHYPDAKMVPDVLPPSMSDIEGLVDPLIQPVQTLAQQADTKSTTTASALGNASIAALSTKSQADGPQMADGSRWTWSAIGTPNGGTVVAAAVSGYWVREVGKIWSARWFAVPGEADSTAKLQAAIDTLPLGGLIEGFGETYNVLDLKLKTGSVLSNIRLTQRSGSVDLKSALVIDGRVGAGAKSDILLMRVLVDGNRAGQTNIVTGTEDGGRHGLRVIGRVYNLTITDSAFNNCASDGIELYSSDQYGAAGDYTFRNIVVKRTTMNGNRRHGMSLDAGYGVLFEDCALQGNGLDLNTVDPLTHGNRGSRFGGNLYGNGADVEGYGVGSACRDIRFIRCVMTGNARGSALWYTGVDSNAAGHQPWRTLIMDGCTLDAGIDVTSEGWGVMFTPPAANKANATKAFADVRVVNCIQSGYVGFISVDTPVWGGGENFTPAPYQPVLMQYCLNPQLGVARLPGRTQVEVLGMTRWAAQMDSMAPTLNPPTFAFEAGQTGTLTGLTVSVVATRASGTLYRIGATFTPDAGGAYASFRVTAAADTTATIQSSGAINNNTGAPRAFSPIPPLLYLTLGTVDPVVLSADVLVT